MKPTDLLLRARSLNGFADLVQNHGGDVDVLLNEVGLTTSLLATPDATLPLTAFTKLLAISAQQLNLPDFGIRLARYQHVSDLGAIALVAENSATVSEGFQGLIRSIRYYSAALRVENATLGENCHVRIFHELPLPLHEHRQLSEYILLNSIDMLRFIAKVEGRDWTVNFDHPRGASQIDYPSLFKCSVNFERDVAEFVFPATVLSLPILSANPVLLDAGERLVRSLIRRNPLDLIAQIESLLREQLGSVKITLPVVAEQLGMPVHTLQRRLADQGMCFEDVLDQLRRQLAEELLPMFDVPLARIADSLGYTSQTSFTRSCRRWFGDSPKTLRARYAGTAYKDVNIR